MTALSDFSALVTSEMNKGTTLDSFIAARIKMAGRRIEKNYTLKYMEALATLTLPVSTSYINVPALYKSLLWMRITNTDGSYSFLHQVDGTQIRALETDKPTGFWQLGAPLATAGAASRWYFDCSPSAAVTITALINSYTDWDSATTGWLLLYAQDLLLAEVMTLMAPLAREPAWVELYKPMKVEGERVLFLADQELRRATADETMIYANRGAT